jgi:hypothetical protein
MQARKAIYTPLTKASTREANASNKITHTHSKVWHKRKPNSIKNISWLHEQYYWEDTSFDKDSNVLIKIIKCLLFGWGALSNMGIKRKPSSTFNGNVASPLSNNTLNVQMNFFVWSFWCINLGWMQGWVDQNGCNSYIFCNVSLVQMGQMYFKYWSYQFWELIWIY